MCEVRGSSLSTTNNFPSDTAMGPGLSNPEMSMGFTSAPEVVYSRMKPGDPRLLSKPVTKICAQAVPAMAHRAVDVAKAESIARLFIKDALSRNRRVKRFQRLIGCCCLRPERLGPFGSRAILMGFALQCQGFYPAIVKRPNPPTCS